jgi:hypothetical protein
MSRAYMNVYTNVYQVKPRGTAGSAATARSMSKDAELGFSPQVLANRRLHLEILVSDPGVRE